MLIISYSDLDQTYCKIGESNAESKRLWLGEIEGIDSKIINESKLDKDSIVLL